MKNSIMDIVINAITVLLIIFFIIRLFFIASLLFVLLVFLLNLGWKNYMEEYFIYILVNNNFIMIIDDFYIQLPKSKKTIKKLIASKIIKIHMGIDDLYMQLPKAKKIVKRLIAKKIIEINDNKICLIEKDYKFNIIKKEVW